MCCTPFQKYNKSTALTWRIAYMPCYALLIDLKMRFNFRIQDLEVRSCGKHLLSDGEHTRAEIVKWANDTDKKEYCWTVAYWNKGKEGYDLQFVGSRPFDVDGELFMKLAKQGQQMLDDAFNCA